GVDRDQRDRPGGVAVRDGEEVLELAGPVSQLEEDRGPGQIQSDASGSESCGAGIAFGGAEPAPQPGGPGRGPAGGEKGAGGAGGVRGGDERAAGGAGGRDRDGAQAGAGRLSGVEARDDVRAPESRGVRGADEGEADQGVAAEGTPVGAGGRREAVGERGPG